MKALWIILSIVALLVVLVAVMIFVGISKMDDVVVMAVEKAGSRVTGTEVTLEDADISLRSGEGALRGLRIANPEGFSDRDAFVLDEVSFKVNMGSLRDAVFNIDEVRVIGPQALVEMNEDGKSNFDVIRSNMERHRGPEKQDGGEAGTPKRMRLEVFHAEQGRVETDATAMGGGTNSLALPSVHLADVGGSEGVTGEELGEAVLEAMNDQVLRTAIEEELGRLLEDQGGVQGLLKKFIK